MQQVVISNFGTAKNSKIGSSKFEMAGKTGTVQVVRISEAEREKGIIKNIDRDWKKRDHALFIGYAPIKNPKYAISVVVEHGGSGSTMAAPIARDVFKKIFNLKTKYYEKKMSFYNSSIVRWEKLLLIDWFLLFIVLILCIIGIGSLYSASKGDWYPLGFKSCI